MAAGVRGSASGCLLGRLAVLRPLGASWGPLRASWGHVGTAGSSCPFGLLLSGPSWGRLGALLGLPGRLRCTLGAGRAGAFFGASWAV
eukprot:3966073-Pyramimonas_sp.AAC.1